MFENYVTLKTNRGVKLTNCNRGVTDLRFFYFCCAVLYILGVVPKNQRQSSTEKTFGNVC